MTNTTMTKALISKLTLVLLTTLFFSNYSLANLELGNAISNIESYPYNLLVQRTDQVKIIYKGDKEISCRVEIQKGEQRWSGDSQVVTVKEFEQSPLKQCLNRTFAKEILASTF
jgi:hypothetical protein